MWWRQRPSPAWASLSALHVCLITIILFSIISWRGAHWYSGLEPVFSTGPGLIVRPTWQQCGFNEGHKSHWELQAALRGQTSLQNYAGPAVQPPLRRFLCCCCSCWADGTVWNCEGPRPTDVTPQKVWNLSSAFDPWSCGSIVVLVSFRDPTPRSNPEDQAGRQWPPLVQSLVLPGRESNPQPTNLKGQGGHLAG